MKLWGSLPWAAALLFGSALHGQVPEPDLPRPGTIIVTETTGQAVAAAGDQRKTLKADDRLRVGSTIETERRSLVSLQFSNGALVQVGSLTELEIEEFGQAPVSGSPKFAEMKAEPTISRTRLRLGRGDVQVAVKPLKAARGSSFTLALNAGTVRIREGSFGVTVQMSDLGLGVLTLEVQSGLVEFEPVGGKFAPVAPGRTLALAIEQDRRTGAITVGEMPKAPKAK